MTYPSLFLSINDMAFHVFMLIKQVQAVPVITKTLKFITRVFYYKFYVQAQNALLQTVTLWTSALSDLNGGKL